MPVTTNTRKLAALLGASGAGIGTDGLLQAAAVDANIATQAELDAVSTTVTANSADTTNVRQDMTILALREAVTENRVANNLPNSFIDQFQDDSGIGTETDTDRNASEYVTTSVIGDSMYSDVWALHQESAGSTTQGHQAGGSGGAGSASQHASTFESGISFTTGSKKWGTNGIDFTSGRANGAAIEHEGASGFPTFRDVANPWTMEMWVYHTSRNASAAEPMYDDTALWAIADTYASINIGDAGRVKCWQYTGSANYNDFDASYALPLNTWTFLAFV